MPTGWKRSATNNTAGESRHFLKPDSAHSSRLPDQQPSHLPHFRRLARSPASPPLRRASTGGIGAATPLFRNLHFLRSASFRPLWGGTLFDHLLPQKFHFLESYLTRCKVSLPVKRNRPTQEMKRIPNEIIVLIAIFLAGVVSVLWYVYDAKAKQRAEAESAPITLPSQP